MGERERSGGTSTTFVGRVDEQRAIAACLADGTAGRSWVVWIEGPAGAGKSALLRQAIARTPDGTQVIRAQSDELATDLSGYVLGQIDEGLASATEPMAAGLALLRHLDDAQHAGPLVLVVEDLHWVDAVSRQALLVAVNRLADDQITVLVTTRPPVDVDDRWDRIAMDPDRCCRIEVGPLTVAEVQALAAGAGTDLSAAAATRLHGHTGGHALWVRTLLAELDGEAFEQPGGSLPAPRSLASTTLGLVGALPPEGQRLVLALAVLNRPAPLSVLADVADVADPTSALDPLVASDLVAWSPDDPTRGVAFTHPLHRAAIYDDLSPTARRDLHRSAAAHLGPAEALAHRVAASDRADTALAVDLRAASAAAASRGEPELAARHLLAAAAVEPDPDQADRDGADAVIELASTTRGARAQALRDQLEARGPSARRDLGLGMLAIAAGDATGAERLLRRAIDAAGDDVDARFIAYVTLGSCFTTLGRDEDAIAAGTAALAIDRAEISPAVYARHEQLAWTAIGFGTMLQQGGAAALGRLHERLPGPALAVASSDVELLVTRGALAFYAGRNTLVRDDLGGAIERARSGSVPRQIPRAHLHLSQASYYLGRWDDALVHGRLARSLAGDGGDVWVEGQAHAILATVLGSRGDEAGATTHLDAARAAADHLQTLELVFTTSIAEAALARALADHDRVIAAIEPLVVHGTEFIPMATTLAWWPALAEAALAQGDVDRVARWADQMETEAHRRSLPFAARTAGLHARVALARHDPDLAADRFDAAVASLAADDAFLERALLHHDRGRLRLARGDRRGGIDDLRQARELLSDVAASTYVDRVDADLAAAGMHSGAGAARGPLDLTEREEDVVALVRQGMTNREVADALYVSTKAVEYHLGNVYGKLGIRSRKELRTSSLP